MGSRGHSPTKRNQTNIITIHDSHQTEQATLNINMDKGIAELTRKEGTVVLTVKNIDDAVRLVRAISIA